MSVSSLEERDFESNKILNDKYAVYIFNINKHVNLERQNSTGSIKSLSSKQIDADQSNVCLSLLETNLVATQETIVRCHFLKAFSNKDAINFENEGKFVVLSDDSQEFGCYYHHLVKDVPVADDEKTSKKISFLICLIGSSIELMESFCYEFEVFCRSLLPLLDAEGQGSCKEVRNKLENWFSLCVEYAKRCIEKFGPNLVVLFHATLYGMVIIVCNDENVHWDLSRFSEACSVNTLLQITSSTQKSSDSETAIHVIVKDDILVTDRDLSNDESSYCESWVEKLLSCTTSDHQLIRGILENFRLKTAQDLNTLKRLLKKAENDHYSLYRAYLFLEASNYANVLLYHVKQETLLTNNEETLSAINCLKDFIIDHHC